MKKKIIALVTVASLVMMTMAGCGSSNNGGGSAASDANGGKVYKIGINQQLEHPALDQATKGFQDKLTELLGEDNVKFDYQNAQGEAANCSTIASGFVASGVDLMFANATTSLQACAAASADIPVVGTSVTDYATALEIDDWTGATGTNVTGTSDLAPLDQQADMIKELVPDVKQVGLVYCSAEPNSVYQVDKVAECLDAAGIAHKSYSAADSNEIQSVVTKAVSECDVLYIPTDNTMAGNTEIINNICLEKKVPVIAGEQGICEGCGIATLSISYYDLGVKSAEMAYDILVNGADPSTMEIAYAPNVTKLYDADRCAQLGITVPDGYEAITAE